MRENRGNIWSVIGTADALCVTTNGMVKNDGALVMGGGIALEAKTRYPNIQYDLGTAVKKFGNIPIAAATDGKTSIVSFPTKDDYRDPSDFFLIAKSAGLLKDMTDRFNWRHVVVPRPGCGLGGLQWADVKKVLEPYFDDRFEIWTF